MRASAWAKETSAHESSLAGVVVAVVGAPVATVVSAGRVDVGACDFAALEPHAASATTATIADAILGRLRVITMPGWIEPRLHRRVLPASTRDPDGCAPIPPDDRTDGRRERLA